VRDFDARTYIGQRSYKSFEPTPINRQWVVDDMEVQQLLSKADRKLGQLDMYAEYVPNLDLFIRMHVVRDTTQSSRIEESYTRIREGRSRSRLGHHRVDLASRGRNHRERLDRTSAETRRCRFAFRAGRSPLMCTAPLSGIL